MQAWYLALRNNINEGIAISYYVDGQLRVVVGCNEKDFDKIGE